MRDLLRFDGALPGPARDPRREEPGGAQGASPRSAPELARAAGEAVRQRQAGRPAAGRCWCCRPWTPAARTAPSSTSSAGVNPAGVPHHRRSRRRRRRSSPTTSCGASTTRCPGRGELGVFNRSHYEDVLVVRVARARAARRCGSRATRSINAFEEHLAAAGTTIVKVFLHISKDEQGERLQARLDDPTKTGSSAPATSTSASGGTTTRRPTRRRWTARSTDVAPWYVVPADRKWYRDWAVSEPAARGPAGPRPQLANARGCRPKAMKKSSTAPRGRELLERRSGQRPVRDAEHRDGAGAQAAIELLLAVGLSSSSHASRSTPGLWPTRPAPRPSRRSRQ